MALFRLFFGVNSSSSSNNLVGASGIGTAASFAFSAAFTLVAATATGAVAEIAPIPTTPITAVSGTGAAAPFTGLSPDIDLAVAAGTGTAADFAFSGVFDGAFGSSSVAPFTTAITGSLAVASATGTAAPIAGISVTGSLGAVSATGAVVDLTLTITSPAVLEAASATGAVGIFYPSAVNPDPGPEPQPEQPPVIVAPPHILNWVWPLSRLGVNTPPIRNAHLLEDGTVHLLEDGTPWLLE